MRFKHADKIALAPALSSEAILAFTGSYPAAFCFETRGNNKLNSGRFFSRPSGRPERMSNRPTPWAPELAAGCNATLEAENIHRM